MNLEIFIKEHPLITEEELKFYSDKALQQTEACLPEFGKAFKSIFSTDGFYQVDENKYWTNGFWTGELWLQYEKTRDERFKEAALWQVKSFKERLDNRVAVETHDLGFLYSLSCVAAYKICGDELGKKNALRAAELLNERFHEKGQFIQAWGPLNGKDNYRLIIDCLLNVPLLMWAGQETGNEEYIEHAQQHIETTLKVIIRDDYSTYHTYYFSPEDGRPLKGETHQGYSADSAWSRGQSWGVYGLALAYRYLRDEYYLELFDRLLEYFLSHLGSKLIPYWDLTFQDDSGEPWDSSASAVVICGLLEMAQYVDEAKAEQYRAVAKILMKALANECAATSPEISNGQLLHGVYGKKSPFNDCISHGVDECNLWGDYFYVEALTRLTSDWNPYW